ncbi:B-box type zinc finger protein ncl-1 [Aphelenchoides fujianensis]|nr:B-box type zinc finger protein ncl-1 [Aphelenchoides fujianensis]
MDQPVMMWNFEEGLSESDSLGTSSAGSETDPISTLLASMTKETAGLSITSTAGGRLTGAFGLSSTPPPISLNGREQTGMVSGWPQSVPGNSHLDEAFGAATGDVSQLVKCPLCTEHFRDPRVLACFHSFCKECLEKQLENNERIVCPQCLGETQISPSLGIDGLLSDYGLQNAVSQSIQAIADEKAATGNDHSLSSSLGSDVEAEQAPAPPPNCTGCTSGQVATAYCVNCAQNLCVHCTTAHRFMHCFEGHQVEELPLKDKVADKQQCNCLEHRTQPLRYFCLTCNFAICKECTVNDHQSPTHAVEVIDDVAEHQMALMEALITDATRKQGELHDMFRLIDTFQQRLTSSLQRAQSQIDETAKFFVNCIQESQRALSKDLEATFACRQLHLTVIDKEIQKMTKKMSQTIEFTQRLLKFSSPTEVMVFKPLLDARLQGFLSFNADAQLFAGATDLDMPSINHAPARSAIFSLMSSMRPDSWMCADSGPTPIGRPSSGQLRGSPNGNPPSNDSALGSSCQNLGFVGSNGSSASSVPQSAHFNPAFGGASAPAASYLASAHDSGSSMQVFNQYEKWSSGLELSLMNSAIELANGGLSGATSELDDKLQNAQMQLYPPRSQIKRQKMIYHCKFGEFGVMEGQFTEPSGVAVSAQNDIIVADTNNHRIQVFNKDGHFKFQFGECGKREGQLLYPNRVSVNRTTGDFIVTERSPTHQIQIYNQYGQFLRKFGANILQHPRGVCVDHQGRIIVVECKVMRVIIFDTYGNVLQKFSCSRYLEFPNGVCTNDKNEIFISDNRAHCIKVFNYEGQYLRQIGGEGITNYPIGVGINAFGEVKHAQCFDVALLEDGVVLASKDYRLYLYRYSSSA